MVGSGDLGSLERDEGVIPGVSGSLETPLPLLRRVKRPAGQLPVQEVNFLALRAVGLDDDMLGATAHALDLLQRLVQVVIVEVVQRVDGEDEVEGTVGVG